MAIAPGTRIAERYRADALLGRGGMGEVWRCRDLEHGHDVAIKAIRAEFLSDPGAAKLFQSEIVAVARLNHPGVVPVYDMLRDERGAALLVMEFRDGLELGKLADEGIRWPMVREILVQVLEALAYAHARGVLHLDIKPENVLVERRGQSVRATLLDFGIARVRRPGRGIERWFDRDAVIGTVEYMSPEQCSGTFERLGPWSDLFSLGAVAFQLCAGERPFPGADDYTGLVRRLKEPPPLLIPGIEGVPPAFGEVCATLLALEPRSRPPCAADVLRALRALDGGAAGPPSARAPTADDPPRSRGARPRSAEDHARSAGRAPPFPIDDVPLPPTGSRKSTSGEGFRALSEHAPSALTVEVQVSTGSLPRAPTAAGDRESLADALTAELPTGPLATPAHAAEAEQAFTAEAAPPPAGAYGLFGLRDLPVLGRPVERRAVWSAVHATVRDRRSHVVLLEGPAGVGKSRIARDAMERAVELGLCVAMQTSWSSDGSGDEGLRGLLENLLDTRGAPAPQLRARLDFWLDRLGSSRSPEAQLHAFVREVELLLRPPRDAAPDAGLPLRVAMEAIARAAAVRPVLLWLDDVQWSRGEATALFEALRTRAPQLPVCVIASVRTAEVQDRASYELFAATPGTERVAVDRLDLDATRRLVRGLLDVDEELCDFLSARAEGNPLFVSLMLRQLVLAEVVGRRGGRYRLTGSFNLSSVPADIDALWRRRVEQSGAPVGELAALSLVRERVSLEVADELGRVRRALQPAIDRALAAGLLHIEGSAYVWEHGLLREYLVKSVRAEEAPALHAHAAAALSPLEGREDVQEERAHHLHKAGRVREACEAMLAAGLWSLRHAEVAPRRSRFERLSTWATEARLLDLAARGQAELGFAHAEVGEAEKAGRALAAARLLVQRGAGAPAASWVAFRHSQSVRLQGRVDDGARFSEEALAHARREGVGEVERLALVQLGIDCCRRRSHDDARRLLEEAADRCRAEGDRVGECVALRSLTYVAEPAAALALVERSLELARAAGALRLELVSKQVLVDLLWRTGSHAAARAEARALSEEAGRRALRQTVSLVELQSAAWAAFEDDWPDARSHREEAARWGAATGAIVERMLLQAVDLNLALSAGDAAEAQRALEAIEQARGSYHEDTFRDLLDHAARRAPPGLGERLRRVNAPAPPG